MEFYRFSSCFFQEILDSIVKIFSRVFILFQYSFPIESTIHENHHFDCQKKKSKSRFRKIYKITIIIGRITYLYYELPVNGNCISLHNLNDLKNTSLSSSFSLIISFASKPMFTLFWVRRDWSLSDTFYLFQSNWVGNHDFWIYEPLLWFDQDTLHSIIYTYRRNHGFFSFPSNYLIFQADVTLKLWADELNTSAPLLVYMQSLEENVNEAFKN